jgi:hypothetical protein
MSVDYRGLRLIEQVLEAEERRDYYENGNNSYMLGDREVSRLTDLLHTWVADKFEMYDLVDIEDRANELLKTFRI